MKKHNALLALLVFAALGFCLGLPQQALSQEEYDGVLKIESFKGKLSRPVAVFDHDLHMERAEDCSSCHHGKTEDGKQDFEDYEPSESCATCHSLDGKDGSTPLKRAYHQLCIGCHTNSSPAPTTCAGCHQK